MSLSNAAVAPQSAQVRYMQGIAVPASSVNPREFLARTRRKVQTEASKTFAGLGMTDTFEMKKTDIIAGYIIRLDGSVTTTKGTGAIGTTARWPHDLIRKLRFTANGQTNIINVSGGKLKARDVMKHSDLTDRGVSQSVNGAAVTQGTLARSCESWGVGSRATNIADGTYDLDLEWFVPVAEDEKDLAGAIFGQTSSTDLTLSIDWASEADLFTKTSNAAVAVAATVQVIAIRYSIPLGPDGEIVVPDLSVFHSLIESRHTDLSSGENEIRLSGQGSGKTLLRIISQLWNGAGSASAPVIPTEDTLGRLYWRFGSNDTPDEYENGQVIRTYNERNYNCDVAAVHGFFVHEFASENTFRDAVDLGTTSEFRQGVVIQSGVALSTPALEVVQEVVYAAGAGS